ncbi:MAG TPA: hypothetical protein VHE99_08615 [Gammaproteobacteria bacterium]|nr:hypothetical protein [Gammaproteobacteria bacterium]
MSREKRLNYFKTAVIARNLAETAHPSYRALFYRLVFIRRMAEFFISALLVFGGQQFIIANHFFSPLWPATGVALAAVFLRGNFPLLGIFFGALASYVLSHTPFSISLIHSGLLVIYVYLTRALALRLIGPIAPIADNAVLWKFYGLIIASSVVLSYLEFVILTQSLLPNLSLWYMGWLGEMNGILCILPFCLIFDPFISKRYFRQPVQLWWVLALVIILGHLFYFAVPTGIILILSCAFLVILAFYAKYFGQFPTCFTLLGIAMIYLSATRPGLHLFHSSSSGFQDKVLLTIFTLTVMLSISIATQTRSKNFPSPTRGEGKKLRLLIGFSYCLKFNHAT